ncbi:MAG: tetratricopeptide repeat protein, partial [Bacteroidota bacterium]
MAARHFYRSLEIYRANNNHMGIITALINIGSIKLQMMEFEDATTNFLEVLSYIEKNIKPESPDSLPLRQLATIYNNLGVIHHNQQEYDQAIDYYQRGIVIARRIKNQSGHQGNLLNNLGRTYDELGRFEQALEVINEALQLRQQQNDKQGIGSSYR